MEAKFHMYYFVCADDLMKPHNSIRVVSKWCGICTEPVHWCFDNSERLNNGDLVSRCSSRVHELTIILRPSTIVPSQDLSEAWVTMCE
jgi:hypothetical protein